MKKNLKIVWNVIQVFILFYVFLITFLVININEYGYSELFKSTYVPINKKVKKHLDKYNSGDLLIIKSKDIKKDDIIYYYTIESSNYFITSSKVKEIKDGIYTTEDNYVAIELYQKYDFLCNCIIKRRNIMGRWSFAPMGSDDALDARGIFLDYVGSLKGVDKYFLDDKIEKARSIFNSLTLQEIDNFLENEPILGYRFVIPYVYLEYEAFDVSIEIKEKLKTLLKESIFEFCNPYCDCDIDYNTYENLLDFNIPQDSNFYHLYCLQVFLNNFEDIFSRKIVFEDQSGLISTILNSKGRNVEDYTPEENEFGNITMYVEGWDESMASFIAGIKDKEIAISILLKMARRGDIWAQRYIIDKYHEDIDIEVCLEILSLYLIFLNSNDIDKLSLECECEFIYSYAWNDDGLSYKKRLSEIYSYIKNNNKTELMDKFYQVYFAYQELGNKYLNMVAIPDFYLKKDISLVESYLSMDFYDIKDRDLCSIYPNDSFSSIKPKKLVIPETYRGRKVVVVEFVEYIEESCELMVVGSNGMKIEIG